MHPSPEQKQVCRQVSQELAEAYPDIDASYVNRACYGIGRTLSKANTFVPETLREMVEELISSKRNRASRFGIPLQDPPILVRRTIAIVHQGKPAAAQVEITSNNWDILTGRLSFGEITCRFTWDGNLFPIPERPEHEDAIRAMAVSLAQDAMAPLDYSRKAANRPQDKLTPHVRRPSEERCAVVVNNHLADSTTRQCLAAEALMWNKARQAHQAPKPEPAVIVDRQIALL